MTTNILPPKNPPATHEGTHQPRGRLTVLVLVSVLALSFAEVILIQATFNSVLLIQDQTSWTVASATVISATTLAWSAGSETAIVHAQHSRCHTIIASVISATWALLGASLSWLQWNFAGHTQVDIGIAAVLISLYLTHGLLTFVYAFSLQGSTPVVPNPTRATPLAAANEAI